MAVASPELFVNGQPPDLRQFPLLHILHDGKRLMLELKLAHFKLQAGGEAF
ncbi:hypothetical protein [Pseudomonas sp. 28 E 9]|nr:hypothetical protein [Pseudomonas sp. 28 E 9]